MSDPAAAASAETRTALPSAATTGATGFVPIDLDGSRWEALAPLYEALLARELKCAGCLEGLILDRSELDASAREAYARLYIRLQGKSLPDNQCPSRLDKGGVVAEAFKISLARAVYVQMVGVGRGDNAHIGRKPVERTVELVGFDYGVRTGRR